VSSFGITPYIQVGVEFEGRQDLWSLDIGIETYSCLRKKLRYGGKVRLGVDIQVGSRQSLIYSSFGDFYN
jgi:hypothetical protein